MANQISVNTGSGSGAQQVIVDSNGNITVTVSRSVIGTVANVASANYANFAGEAFDVAGANVTGAVSSATTAGTVTTAAQPNITSVGNLTSLNVNNTITTGNLIVTGNLQVGNLVANTANYANFAGEAFDVAGANVTGAVANAVFADDATFANYVGYAVQNTTNTSHLVSFVAPGFTANKQVLINGNFIFNPASETLQVNQIVSNGALLTNITGANVSGTVANATYAANAGNANTANSATVANSANSVTLANVSGAGNIAGINLDGNVSNLLTGNGTFVAIPTGGGNVDNISNGTSNVSVPAANGNIEVYANTQHWTFADNGNLILADGNGVIQSIANSSLDPILPNVSTMVLTPDQNYTSQALVLDPTTPGHIHLRAPGSNIDQPLANIYLGGEQSSFEVGVYNGAAPNLFIHSGNNNWAFDNAGNLTLPGNTFAINYANGTQVPVDNVANANYANFAGNAYAVDGANVSGAVANATFALDSGNANIANIAYSVDGANVSGAVANATFALDAGNANIANIAYSVDGANVSGTVANATFALDAGNANIANIAYSVDAANVSGLGNIATINLDGNVSNLLTGNGTFVAIPTSVANANYANFAGTVLTNAQPNITSVGNLSALTVTGNLTGNAITWSNLLTYTGNTAASDKILVQADLAGALAVRNLGFRAGNVSNVSASNTSAGGLSFNGGLAQSSDTGNVFIARAGMSTISSGIATTANGAAFSGNFNLGIGTAFSNNANATSGVLSLTGGAAVAANGNAIIGNSSITGGSSQATNGNAFGGTISFTGANANATSNGTATGGNINITSGSGRSANGNSSSGTINITTGFANSNVTAGTATVGSININTGTANGVTANVLGNINIGNSGSATAVNIGAANTPVNVGGNFTAVGRLDYLRTFGSFTSNATQTNSNVGNAVYMTLNNDEGSNGVSIVSSSQITVARTGRYNIQFSAQMEKTDGGTDTVEIWLTKNGSSVANSATRLRIQGTSEKDVAAWNWVDNATTANTYYQIAWASTDANMQLVAIDTANTLSGVAVPSLIVTVVPVGA